MSQTTTSGKFPESTEHLMVDSVFRSEVVKMLLNALFVFHSQQMSDFYCLYFQI